MKQFFKAFIDRFKVVTGESCTYSVIYPRTNGLSATVGTVQSPVAIMRLVLE